MKNKRILLVFFLLACSFIMHGAHLVGGELSYTCKGNNLYELKLRIYRDCASGGAEFDEFARVAAYDKNRNQVVMFSIPHGQITRVNPNTGNNPCLTVPVGLCTEYTEYIQEVSLPPLDGGYTLVHQRCCRNNSIDNVNNSGNFGNTYSIEIPSMDTVCNNSPQFNGYAPTVLCLNEPLNIPLDITESDGDSLVISLCNIFSGGGQGGGFGCNSVIPFPPCAPPFSPINFAAPFSAQNPMPANPVFSIDSLGVLHGKPNAIGRYVVGICATEFRNGQYISTTRLDYQFNVSDCQLNVVSDMITETEDPTILCDNLTVQFTSQTNNAVGLLWDFGDPTTNMDTSTAANPVWVYPDTGRYFVKLYANPGLLCGDTLTELFHLKYVVLPKINWFGTTCFDAQDIQFQTVGDYPPNSTFEWDFGADSDLGVFTGRTPPKVTWTTPGRKYVTLDIAWGACSRSFIDSVDVSSIGFNISAGPDQYIFRNQEVIISASGGDEYRWIASKPIETTSYFDETIKVKLRPEDDTVQFKVIATDFFGCVGVDSMLVIVGDEYPRDYTYNVITPNGDGKNDYFDLGNINPDQDMAFKVYNRWGVQVYEKPNYANDWQGIDSGLNPLPDGTYYFFLEKDGNLIYSAPVNIFRNP